MTAKNKTTGEQYLLTLRVINEQCDPVTGASLKSFCDEEEFLAAGSELTQAQMKIRRMRGPCADYKTILLAILSVPKNPQAGADYAEMSTVIPLIRKIRAAARGDDLYLDKAEYTLLQDRVKNNKYGQVTEALYQFIADVDACAKVAVAPADSK